MNVYGILVHAPADWPIEPAPNGNRQRHVVVAAKSRAEALRRFAAVGVEISAHTFRAYGSEHVGGDVGGFALDHPGHVFYQPKDFRGGYRPAPGQDPLPEKKPKRVRPIRIDDADHELAEERAKTETNGNVSELYRRAIAYGIAHMPKEWKP